MKLKLCVLGCMLTALCTIYFVSVDDYNTTSIFRIGFKFLLLAVFLLKAKVQNMRLFYAFFTLVVVTDLLSFLITAVSEWFAVPMGFLFFLCYLILLKDGCSQFKIKDTKNVVAIYYFFVIGINAFLVGIHLYNLYSFMEGRIWLYVSQVFYNIVLYLMIILALAYYLNSYSRKSMFFLIGTLAFVCSDILVSAYYFYNITENIIFFHTLLSMLGYVFFFNYFFTKEAPLQIEEEILEELRMRKKAAKPPLQ